MVATPTTLRAVAASRVARKAGRLRVAMKALDYAFAHRDGDAQAAQRMFNEAAKLARDLEQAGASLSALSQWLRAWGAGLPQAERYARNLIDDYADWRPEPRPIGVPRDTLLASATGAFWVNAKRRGRITTLQGGITGESTDHFNRVLDLSADDVSWLFLDVSGLNYVGSTGLAIAVKIAERLHTQKGGLALFSVTANLRLLVDTLGLTPYLNPVDSLSEALQVALKPA